MYFEDQKGIAEVRWDEGGANMNRKWKPVRSCIQKQTNILQIEYNLWMERERAEKCTLCEMIVLWCYVFDAPNSLSLKNKK